MCFQFTHGNGSEFKPGWSVAVFGRTGRGVLAAKARDSALTRGYSRTLRSVEAGRELSCGRTTVRIAVVRPRRARTGPANYWNTEDIGPKPIYERKILCGRRFGVETKNLHFASILWVVIGREFAILGSQRTAAQATQKRRRGVPHGCRGEIGRA